MRKVVPDPGRNPALPFFEGWHGRRPPLAGLPVGTGYESMRHGQAAASPVAPGADLIAAGGGDMVLAYDAENRLIAVEPAAAPANGDKKVEFIYDYMSRRVAKTVYAYDASATAYSLQSKHLFVYDNWNLIEEQTTLNSPTPETHKTHYVWGLDLSGTVSGAGGAGGIRGLIARADATDTYLYGHDANGHVSQMINAADGSLVAQYAYDAYGNLLHSSGALADENPFRYSTKYRDSETGLYYYGYRYYAPELGRWINRDPLGELGGLNLYGFVGNDPVNFVDPLGLEAIIRAAPDHGLIGDIEERWDTDTHFFVDPVHPGQRFEIINDLAYDVTWISFAAMAGYTEIKYVTLAYPYSIRQALSGYFSNIPEATHIGLLTWIASTLDDYIDTEFWKQRGYEFLFGTENKENVTQWQNDPCE